MGGAVQDCASQSGLLHGSSAVETHSFQNPKQKTKQYKCSGSVANSVGSITTNCGLLCMSTPKLLTVYRRTSNGLTIEQVKWFWCGKINL